MLKRDQTQYNITRGDLYLQINKPSLAFSAYYLVQYIPGLQKVGEIMLGSRDMTDLYIASYCFDKCGDNEKLKSASRKCFRRLFAQMHKLTKERKKWGPLGFFKNPMSYLSKWEVAGGSDLEGLTKYFEKTKDYESLKRAKLLALEANDSLKDDKYFYLAQRLETKLAQQKIRARHNKF